MRNVKNAEPAVFIQFSGTENGLTSQDTTACTDSLASIMANGLLVLGPFPSDYQDSVAPFQDQSKYDT
jgi:hypothetical protein